VVRTRGVENEIVRWTVTAAEMQIQQTIDTEETSEPGLDLEHWERAIFAIWDELHAHSSTFFGL
jgi:hypothetical protein